MAKFCVFFAQNFLEHNVILHIFLASQNFREFSISIDLQKQQHIFHKHIFSKNTPLKV